MYLLSILLFTFVYLLSFNSVIEENRDRYSIQTFAIVMITIFLDWPPESPDSWDQLS